jgi:hypothetical protein
MQTSHFKRYGHLDRRLAWSSHIDQARRKASQTPGILNPPLNKGGGLSITNGLTLYRQLISPTTMLAEYGGWRQQPVEKAPSRSIQMLAYYCWCTLVHQQCTAASGSGDNLIRELNTSRILHRVADAENLQVRQT